RSADELELLRSLEHHAFGNRQAGGLDGKFAIFHGSPCAPPRRASSASLCARLRGLLDRFANAQIGPTAADVAGHRVVDIGIRRMRIARKQRRSGHALARLAVAPLTDL